MKSQEFSDALEENTSERRLGHQNRMVDVSKGRPLDGSEGSSSPPLEKIPSISTSGLSILAYTAAAVDQRDSLQQRNLLLQVARNNSDFQQQQRLLYHQEVLHNPYSWGILSSPETVRFLSQLRDRCLPQTPITSTLPSRDSETRSTHAAANRVQLSRAPTIISGVFEEEVHDTRGKETDTCCECPQKTAKFDNHVETSHPSRSPQSFSSSVLASSFFRQSSKTGGTKDGKPPKAHRASMYIVGNKTSSFPRTIKSGPSSITKKTKPVVITETTDEDVLCIRSRGKIYDPPGNQAFRNIAQDHRHLYLLAKKKVEKVRVVTSIIDQVHGTGGRFLKRIDNDHDLGVGVSWQELTKSETMQKTRDLLIRLCNRSKRTT